MKPIIPPVLTSDPWTMKQVIGIAVTVIAAASVAVVLWMDGSALWASSSQSDVFQMATAEEIARSAGKDETLRILKGMLEIEERFLPAQMARVERATTAKDKITAQDALDESKGRIRDILREMETLK